MKIYKHAQTVNAYRCLVDLLCVIAGWFLAFEIRFNTGLIELTKGTDSFANYAILLPILVVSYLFVFLSTGLYRRSLERRRVWEENFDLLRSHVLSFFVFVTSAYFLFEHRYSRLTLVVYAWIVPFLLPFGRSMVRKVNRFYLNRRPRSLRAIVVGSGRVAKRVEDLAKSRIDWGIEVIRRVPATDAKLVHDLLVGDSIDVVFIALNPQESGHLQEIFDALGNTVAEVMLLPDFGEASFLASHVMSVDTLPAIALNRSNLDGYGRVIKRGFDIIVALAALVIFSPVFGLCAVLVKLSSPGPVFYKQERMGLDGRTFACLKFRGMTVDAEKNTGPVWAKADDGRTTSVGKWLRRTSLDEIPQFINVLKGEMSVVGPRPERPVFVSDFRNNIPGYMLRHKVKAGITGWAQINGWRGNTSLEKRIECDLWYIQNWSLWLDLKICCLTPFKGFIHPNAY